LCIASSDTDVIPIRRKSTKDPIPNGLKQLYAFFAEEPRRLGVRTIEIPWHD
jgi:hypothetical protein